MTQETTWEWIRESEVRGEVLSVCAGRSGADPRAGVILMQFVPVSGGPDLPVEERSLSFRESGAITLTSAPQGSRLDIESVTRAVLRFRTADGRSGRIQMAPELADVKVTLLD